MDEAVVERVCWNHKGKDMILLKAGGKKYI